MMTLDYAGYVTIGIRETNDDRALILGAILDQTCFHGRQEGPGLMVVCDGCGGYAGGGIAAQAVLEILQCAGTAFLTDEPAVAEALETAAKAVEQKKAAMPEFAAMCTTVAGCVFLENSTMIFHAGDSRVYRYDGYGLARMTVDHSLVQNLVDAGRLTEEEARVSPQRSTITRCIGVPCPPPEIYVSEAPIAPGEIYLICSDGLWEVLQPGDIKAIFQSGWDLPTMAEQLVAAALQAGSDDNISVCLCSRPGEVRREAAEAFVLD